LRALAKSLESESRNLAADVLAVRMVLAHVLGRIYQLDPILAEAIQGGFEDAEGIIQKAVATSHKRASSDQAVKALTVVDALRAAIVAKTDIRFREPVANDNK
jgi:hypothetical protein